MDNKISALLRKYIYSERSKVCEMVLHFPGRDCPAGQSSIFMVTRNRPIGSI